MTAVKWVPVQNPSSSSWNFVGPRRLTINGVLVDCIVYRSRNLKVVAKSPEGQWFRMTVKESY